MTAVALGDVSARTLCLGLLLQREDTAQGVDRRLNHSFASANFTRGAASKNLPRLAKQGLVEVVERGKRPPFDRYRITSAGEQYFLDWLHHTEFPPVVRDALQCKIEFFRPDEMPTVISTIEEQALLFATGADMAHEKLKAALRIRRAQRARGLPPDWNQELAIAKIKDAAVFGHAMADRLTALTEELTDIHAEFPDEDDGRAALD